MLDRLIAEANAQAESERLNAERFVREQRSLDEQAPAVWKRFRSSLKTLCGQHSDSFKFDICDENEAIIRGHGRALEVQFLSASKVVAYQCNGGTGHCTILLNRRNIAVLCDAEGVSFPSEDYAADQLLSLILQKVAFQN